MQRSASVGTSLLGWTCSAVLVLTIATQVVHQSRRRSVKGVSPWLFIGQLTASVGLFGYSILRTDWVFVTLNAAMATAAVAGLAVWHRQRRREAARRQTDSPGATMRVARALLRRRVMQTVIDILEHDHETVRKLLDELVATTTRGTKKRTELLRKIETELQVHTTVEEEIFYPAVRDAARTNRHKEMVAEALEEHRAVEELILPDLKDAAVDSVQFGGRAKVLRELVDHHAGEEEDELFPLAKELLNKDRLAELGEHVAARKQELLRELHAA